GRRQGDARRAHQRRARGRQHPAGLARSAGGARQSQGDHRKNQRRRGHARRAHRGSDGLRAPGLHPRWRPAVVPPARTAARARRRRQAQGGRVSPRASSVYRCQECGFASPKPGTCPDCLRAGGAYVQLVEERAEAPASARRGGAPASGRPQPLKDVVLDAGERLPTGIAELDRVLGGGVVRGSLVLIGGEPGAGKSTLLLQAARALAKARPPVLYVSAEESAAQVKMRADRLGIAGDGLLLWTETDLAAVEAQLDDVKPRALVVDSIQTVFLPELESAPGSVAQVRECGARLGMLAKGRSIATFLVGHVTKEGALAGPRVLEHLVDTVLYFEGESHHAYRVLRAVKNRFGSSNEIGVFQMGERG